MFRGGFKATWGRHFKHCGAMWESVECIVSSLAKCLCSRANVFDVISRTMRWLRSLLISPWKQCCFVCSAHLGIQVPAKSRAWRELQTLCSSGSSTTVGAVQGRVEEEDGGAPCNWPLCMPVLMLFAANECDEFGSVEVITGACILLMFTMPPATVTCKLAWCPSICTDSLYSAYLLLCTDWYVVVMHVYYPNGCFTDARLCCHMYIFSVIPLYAFIVVCSSANYCGPLFGRETFFIFTLGHKHIVRPLSSVLIMWYQ